ncbi:hypothetical protein INR49_008750 [Caranx melampygus]|nr:hypothetical protein INR49_008750 [Caranx melampygus]
MPSSRQAFMAVRPLGPAPITATLCTMMELQQEEPKHHISDIVPAQQYPTQPQQASPQQDQESEWGGQHKVSKQEPSTHGSTGGMAGGERVAVHRKRSKHVHTVMCWPTPTHHCLDNGNQDEIQQEAWRKGGGTVGGASQPGDAMSRDLYQFHQRAHTSPGRVLAGANPQLLGQPQVDGEQGAERYADEGRVKSYAVLFWPLTARRARGGARAPAPSGALRGSEPGGGRVGALPLEQVRR